MRAVIRFIKEVWSDCFGRTEYLIFHILAVLCCSIFGTSSYFFRDLFFPWLNLHLPTEHFAVLAIAAAIGWMFFAAVVPMACGRIHTGQVLITAVFGFSLCNTLLLMQHRPLWAAGLFAVSLLAGLRIPAEEYTNSPGGGHLRIRRQKLRTLMRRANTAVVCMCLSWVLLAVDRVMPVQVEEKVADAVNGGIGITETRWDTFDEGERYQALALILEKECAGADIPRPELILLPLPEETLGGFFKEDYTVALNSNLLADSPALTCIRVILHEYRHCWQYRLSLADPDDLSGELQLAAAVFRENLQDYQSSAYGYDLYSSQPIESDARKYAEEHISDYYLFIPADILTA